MGAPQTIKVLDRLAAILDALAEQGELSIPDIARITGLPRPSVYRLLDSLMQLGMVKETERGTVNLGTRLLELGDRAAEARPEVRASATAMKALLQETGQTVFISIRQGWQALCVSWLPGRDVALTAQRPGMRFPLNAGAASRAIFAFEPSQAFADEASAPFTQFTPHTIMDLPNLLADAAEIRRRAFAISDQDVTVGVAALAAPVFDRADRLVAAVGITGLRESIMDKSLVWGNLLCQAATDIRAEL
jgi:IclR family acetate operon transcriptional repressor